MKAMIFAAGLGSRLKPLTDNKPKALVEIAGKPMIEWTIKKLIDYGFTEIIINVHHFAGQIIEFLKKNNNFDISISISDESDYLLDTGGGLKKASWFFDNSRPFLVYNVDVISNINLTDLMSYHITKESLATLVVRNRESSRYLLFDDNFLLAGWLNEKTDEKVITRNPDEKKIKLAFSGIQIISPEMLSLINEEGKFSNIDIYLRLSEKYKITGYQDNDSYWFDLGEKNKFKIAENFLVRNKIRNT